MLVDSGALAIYQPPTILHNHCFHFLLGITVVLTEIEENACKILGNQEQGVLWAIEKW